MGRWAVQQDNNKRLLQRLGAERLFPSPERGNKYAVLVEGHSNNSGNGQTSELTLIWDRTGVPGGSVSIFVSPYWLLGLGRSYGTPVVEPKVSATFFQAPVAITGTAGGGGRLSGGGPALFVNPSTEG